MSPDEFDALFGQVIGHVRRLEELEKAIVLKEGFDENEICKYMKTISDLNVCRQNNVRLERSLQGSNKETQGYRDQCDKWALKCGILENDLREANNKYIALRLKYRKKNSKVTANNKLTQVG